MTMPLCQIDQLLPHVQKPSRYLGTEINHIRKDHRRVRLKFALAFPDLYDIGTSHFGMQILYHLLNQDADVAAERVFAPAQDMETLLRSRDCPLTTLESQTPLADFDIVGFSLLYELNYTNVLNMIDLAGLPLRWSRRRERHPLIIAGGPCVSNPEPMAAFFDAMVFGDGEDLVPAMTRIWMSWKTAGGREKVELLERWSRLEGVYVPRFFQARIDPSGLQRLAPLVPGQTAVSRAIIADLDRACFPDRPILPFGKPVHDRLRMEIARGCTRGCRFCQAGMIYRPVRERSPQTIQRLIREALVSTGYEDLSLLSLSTGDYSCLPGLMEQLMRHCQAEHVAISLPSLRAGSLTPELMALIRSVRKTGFTIAPEAGSQRLRDVINKNITFADVAATVEDAFALGWTVIKLYFMIGLPTETEDDLDAIVDMVRELRNIKGPQRRRSQINVSVTTFIPKAHTPFQWCAQLSLEESKAKLAHLKSRLAMPGVRLKWQSPEMSLLEGALARGDRRLADVVEQAWSRGARFDGWNDQFQWEHWQQAFTVTGIDPDSVVLRRRELEEPLPWDHMDAGVDPEFLKRQWRKSLENETVEDCRLGSCQDCGVCDLESLAPVVFEPAETEPLPPAQTGNEERDHVWFELTYSKKGQARFFGHLELSNIMARAVRRARIRVKYSQGFHPMPRISFDDPPPLGVESQAEKMRLLASPGHTCTEIIERLNSQLPGGLQVSHCRTKPTGKRVATDTSFCYRVFLGRLKPSAGDLRQFQQSRHWPYLRKKPKGRSRKVDLRQLVSRLELEGDGVLLMEIQSTGGITVRAAEVLAAVFGLSDEQLADLRILKLDVCP